MVALTRRALRNEVRTLQAQLDTARTDVARLASQIGRHTRINTDQQTTIATLQARVVALQEIVQDLRHYQGRKDMDLRSFIANARRAEQAELDAQQAREALAAATVRIQEMTRISDRGAA